MFVDSDIESPSRKRKSSPIQDDPHPSLTDGVDQLQSQDTLPPPKKRQKKDIPPAAKVPAPKKTKPPKDKQQAKPPKPRTSSAKEIQYKSAEFILDSDEDDQPIPPPPPTRGAITTAAVVRATEPTGSDADVMHLPPPPRSPKRHLPTDEESFPDAPKKKRQRKIKAVADAQAAPEDEEVIPPPKAKKARSRKVVISDDEDADDSFSLDPEPVSKVGKASKKSRKKVTLNDEEGKPEKEKTGKKEGINAKAQPAATSLVPEVVIVSRKKVGPVGRNAVDSEKEDDPADEEEPIAPLALDFGSASQPPSPAKVRILLMALSVLSLILIGKSSSSPTTNHNYIRNVFNLCWVLDCSTSQERDHVRTHSSSKFQSKLTHSECFGSRKRWLQSLSRIKFYPT